MSERDPRFDEARSLLKGRAGIMRIWQAFPPETRGAVCHALLERCATIDRVSYEVDGELGDVERFHDVLAMNAEAYRVAVSILALVAESNDDTSSG